jgi:hypothetical protein
MQPRSIALTSFGVALLFIGSTALAQYQLTNLVSNQVGVARHDDPLLVNAWGMVHAPGSPWWISDNNSGWSTLYNASGIKQGLVNRDSDRNGWGRGLAYGHCFQRIDFSQDDNVGISLPATSAASAGMQSIRRVSRSL